MPRLVWKEIFRIHDDLIDAQHRMLFDCVNRLDDALSSEQESCLLDEILQSLSDYAIFHFRAEEQIMDDTGYPGLGAHRKQHEFFVDTISSHRESPRQQTTAANLLTFVRDWVLYHILTEDVKFGEYRQLGRGRRSGVGV